MIHKILGPPGTGKTSRIAEILAPKSNVFGVLALAFTRATKWALLAKDRRLTEDNVKTVHSMVYISLGLTKNNILLPGQIASYYRSQRLDYSIGGTDGALDIDKSRIGNKIEAVISRAIHMSPKYRGSTPWEQVEEAISNTYDPKETRLYIQPSTIIKFARKYWEYQCENEQYDYNGMLLQCAIEGLHISGDILIMDEAQDLTPLMISLLQPQWPNFGDIYVVGDDDQAIFNFAGSDSQFLIDLQADNTRILNHSWRLPQKIHAVSQEFINRNDNRIEKIFSASDREGSMSLSPSITDAVSRTFDKFRSILIITRMRHRLKAVRDELTQSGILYRELGDNPIKPPNLTRLILNALWTIRKAPREKVFLAEWEAIFSNISATPFRGIAPKTKIARWIFEARSPRDIAKLPNGDRVIKILERVDLGEFRNAKSLKTWSKVWCSRDYDPDPKVRIGTIHQSKGLEADAVIYDTKISNNITRRITSEDERRVSYVAITRAQQHLTLVGDGHKELISLVNKYH